MPIRLVFASSLLYTVSMASRTAMVGLATGLAGFLLGSYRSESPIPLPVTLDGATIAGVHLAALDLRTASGQERHSLSIRSIAVGPIASSTSRESAGIWN